MDFKDHFKDKKITVMGLGLLGRGIGDTAFLAECGAEVTVTDLKDKEQLADSFNRLKGFSNLKFVFGEHRMEDFENRDMVLVAAGVPMDSPYVAHAHESGVQITQSAALFAKLSGIPIIGVTGTRGKSTVTGMIHHTLTYATAGAPVLLGGNVRGVSNLQLLKDVHDDSVAVMELDSWQLQGFGWEKISPHIAVFTTFMEDHMNYYHNDMDAYFADKANIFLNQEESDVFIATAEVFEWAKKFAAGKRITLGQEVVLADSSVLPEGLDIQVPGEHNRLNAALAFEALKATSLDEEAILEGLATFRALPGRLEFLREVDGVKVYNDNNATTPAATLAALRAVGKQGSQNIVLIMGGADKGIDMSELLAEIPKYCKKVVLLPGTGTDHFRELLEDTIIYDSANSMEAAVKSALGAAECGGTILFSPAFASFGMFKNEYERSDQFVVSMNKLINQNEI